MKKLVFAIAILLVVSPGLAQTSKKMSAHIDDCAPIGRTGDGQLIYSLKCNNLPAPPPPQAVVEPPPEPAVVRSGFLGMSYPPGQPPPSAPAGRH